MNLFSQWPNDHVGSAGEFYQNCPCFQCRAYFKTMNENLQVSVRNKPQNLWNEQEAAYVAAQQVK